MKTFLKLSIFILLTLSLNAQVGIGTTDPQAALDIRSSDQASPTNQDGILIPKVDEFPLTNPTATQDGMMVFVTGLGTPTKGFYYWDETAGVWANFGGATGWLTTGNNDIVDGTSFLGTVTGTNVDVAFRRNGAAAGRIGTTSTSFGVGALVNAAGSNSTAIGNNALAVSTGSNNVAIGQNALQDSNTTAQWNTAVGVNALSNINSNAAQDNVAVGYSAMGNGAGNISGVVAIGSRALFQNTASNTTAIGFNALQGQVNNATNNTGVGYRVLNNNTAGDNNTVIGNEAGAEATGSNNTFIGNIAGKFQAAGDNNILIGSNVASIAGSSNQIVIGGGVAGTAYVNAPSWLFSSDRRLKTDIIDSPLGLDFIKTIRPVSYKRIDNSNKETEFGFIAQELQIAFKNSGIDNHGIVSKTANGLFAVRYNDFLPMTVKAVQEQQVLIEKLQKDNEQLKAMNEAILKRLGALEAVKTIEVAEITEIAEKK